MNVNGRELNANFCNTRNPRNLNPDTSTLTLINYPQMLDRCYTDCHLFQICLASVDYFFPRRTRINTDFYSVYSVFSVDFFFTRKVTDGHGCPHADEDDIVYHLNLDGI